MNDEPTGWLAKLLGAPDRPKGYDGESPPEGYEFIYDETQPFGKRIITVKKPEAIGWGEREIPIIETNPNDVIFPHEPGSKYFEPQGGAGIEGNIRTQPGKLPRQIMDQIKAYEERKKKKLIQKLSNDYLIPFKRAIPPDGSALNTIVAEQPSKPFILVTDSTGKRYLKVK